MKKLSQSLPRVNETINLIPKTRHAKNRVREHGSIVDVTIVKESSFCVTHRVGDSWRWVDVPNDEHFDFERPRENG